MFSLRPSLRWSALACVALLTSGASGCASKPAPNAAGDTLSRSPVVSSGKPTLLLFLTIDQLRGDYLERFGPSLSAGLVRLQRGAWFQRAYQDHAITETAPGHASTMSGRFPRSTNIMSNSAGVVDSRYPLLLKLPEETGASPDRFRGTTLFDWLKAADRRTRALSVSMKDRAAILPIGRAKEDVYWYTNLGGFTTSTWYREKLPDWVVAFNERRIPYQLAGRAWELTRPAASYPEPDSVAFENFGRGVVFPHRFPEDSLATATAIRATPYIDSVTALFALEALRQTGIGRGPHTDIFAVSFSATDIVGHTYGPDSREAHENAIRLDQTLGWFLDSLYTLRDSASILIALTADHGVQTMAEVARERGLASANQGLRGVTLRPQVTAVQNALRTRGVDPEAFLYDGELIGLDRKALAAARLDADSILAAFRSAALRVPGVERVDYLKDLRRADLERDVVARRWTHQVAEGTAVEMVVTLTQYSLWRSSVLPATHGSPWDQDAHVPIIFSGPGIKPGKHQEFARVVDIAPTLATLLGVKPLEMLDGRVLRAALQRP